MNATRIRNLRAEGKHEEAANLAAELASRFPDDSELQFEAACVHDYLGRETQAVPYYRAALDADLSSEHRLQALVGLGSTFRTLGRYTEARNTLATAVAEFPEAAEAKAFFAMALYNCGQSKAAVELLLSLLAATSAAPGIVTYRRAIEFYAQDIERNWS